MISTNENLLLWEQRINERTKSGMTVKEWYEKMESSEDIKKYFK